VLGVNTLMFRTISLQAWAAGFLAGFVGFASSFAIIVHGLHAVGATDAEAASGLMALSLAMGLGGILLSLKTHMPISVAWSTPGAALLVSTGMIEGGFAGAVGAFLISGLFLVIAGLWKPLGQAIASIPASLANAMLAGILLHLCLAPVHAVAEKPLVGLAVVVTWVLVAHFKRVFAVPAAFLMMILLIAISGEGAAIPFDAIFTRPVLVMPTFSMAGVISIAIPLFIVTMASQNIPGIAVLAIHGFKPEPSPLFTITGLLTLISVPFGGHAVNLAAITAAMCTGPDANPDPARRYWAGVSSGVLYIILGLVAGGATALISVSPPVLIEAVAGLALVGAFGSSVHVALAEPKDRDAAVITFLVAASGLSIFGVGGAFWGLLAGGFVLLLKRLVPFT